MFGIFRKPAPEVVPRLGTFVYRDDFWVGEVTLGSINTELALDGDKTGIDPFAKSYALEKFDDLANFWEKAVAFSIDELLALKAPFRASASDFVLNSIAIFKKNSFDNGHLAFWFEIKSDAGSVYYVSFLNEQPNILHRDS